MRIKEPSWACVPGTVPVKRSAPLSQSARKDGVISMSERWKGATNIVLRALCLLVAAACLTMLLWQWNTTQKGQRANDAMRELYDPSANAEEQKPEVQEVFSNLLEANPETVAWLRASDTLDFAIVQRDNSFYLDHNFFGEYTQEGTAFLDADNLIYPADEHLLIHGHNMKNGSVFGDLDQYRELSYMLEHPLIEFNTIYENEKYVPIAIFDISTVQNNANYFRMQQFQFESDEEFNNFVQGAKDRSYFDIPISVERGDQLLSLVTCSYFDDNGRFVLMMRAVRPDENPDAMVELVQQSVKK